MALAGPPAAASRRFGRFPAFSSISRFTGIDAVRFVSCRGAQKASLTVTSEKGTPSSRTRVGASCPRTTAPESTVFAP